MTRATLELVPDNSLGASNVDQLQRGHEISNEGLGTEKDIQGSKTEPVLHTLVTETPLQNDQSPNTPQKYSIWSRNEKRAIILAGSLAGFFSPLTASIYFPALNTIAAALNVSGTRINLTITTYTVLQGIAPMLIAGFSDTIGRRPAYIACFTIYSMANLGLGLQNSYGALMALRCIQSAGSSSTIALASGLVGDLITSEERGTYIAFSSVGSILGPMIAPIIGGLISQYLDWHWIFWVLLILGLAFAIPLVLFLPETCRKIVGDGSIPPPRWDSSITDIIRHRKRKLNGFYPNVKTNDKPKKLGTIFGLPNQLPAISVLTDLESFLILLCAAWIVCCYYSIQTGAASSLKTVYGFNDIQIALMFCPLAGSGILAAFTAGKLIDWNYRRHAKIHNITIIKGVKQDLSNFPIERARLEIALPMGILSSLFVIGWGWTMNQKVVLAGPIIIMFLFGYTASASWQTFNVLMVDIWPGKAAAATAANNFVRCELGAIATAVIEPMANSMGRGWAYTTFALIQIAFSPVLVYIARHGIEMRKARAKKEIGRKKRMHTKMNDSTIVG